MTDYAREDRQKFLRQVRYMALLRAVYVAIVGLSTGGLVFAIINLFSRKYN